MEEGAEKVYDPSDIGDEPIPLSSKAEMHREQRRIIRERKLAEKKRLREQERARRAEERRRAKEASQVHLEDIPADDADLEAEAKLEEMLDDQLSAEAEDIMDDLGLDMNEILRTMTEAAKKIPDETKKE